MRKVMLLALGLALASCTVDEVNCEPDVNVDGKLGQVVMSKEPYPHGGFKYEYRLGCEGLYGTLVLSAEEYEIGDIFVTHQQYEENRTNF